MSDQLYEHSDEGIELIVAAPSIGARGLLYLIATLIITGAVWSYFGRADVVITCRGLVVPASDPRRVYCPVPGELIDVYVAKGDAVTEGTVLALVKAPGAIQAATQAVQAMAQYENAKRDAALLPEKMKLQRAQLGLLKTKKEYAVASIGDAEDQLKAFDEAMKLKVEVVRDTIRRADEAIKEADKKFKSYEGLLEKGAVSRNEYDEKRLALKSAIDQSKTTRLQSTTELARAIDEKRAKLVALEQKKNQVLAIQLEIAKMQGQIDQMEIQSKQQLEMARVQMEAAQKVTFKDLDAQNYLQIKAPMDGIVTEVAYTQAGDKVSPSQPAFTISAQSDRRALKIRVSDRDRAHLTPGVNTKVKIKVRAYPYMRYGYLSGYLDSISPSPQFKKEGIVYDGRVLFDQDPDNNQDKAYFIVNDEKQVVRHGMTAMAEIVVERRRLIDFALDTVRKLKP